MISKGRNVADQVDKIICQEYSPMSAGIGDEYTIGLCFAISSTYEIKKVDSDFFEEGIEQKEP